MMSRIVVFCLLSSLDLSAGNYIDNPNFDLGASDWYCSGEQCHNGEVVRYIEHNRQQAVYDQFIKIDRSATYIIKNVPPDVQLHWSAEMSYAGNASECLLEVELYQYRFNPKITLKGFSVNSEGGFLGYGSKYNIHQDIEVVPFNLFDPNSVRNSDVRTLSRKKVAISGNDSWHHISADYPGYVTDKGRDYALSFIVFNIKNECSENILLNYAQVGTDARLLGGRGARKKGQSL